jgi:hypothetical protein
VSLTWSSSVDVKVSQSSGPGMGGIRVQLGDQTSLDAGLTLWLPPNHAGPTRLNEKALRVHAQFTDGQDGEDRAATLLGAIKAAMAKVKSGPGYMYNLTIDPQSPDTVVIGRPLLL